jgi:hypothetical protein
MRALTADEKEGMEGREHGTSLFPQMNALFS